MRKTSPKGPRAWEWNRTDQSQGIKRKHTLERTSFSASTRDDLNSGYQLSIYLTRLPTISRLPVLNVVHPLARVVVILLPGERARLAIAIIRQLCCLLWTCASTRLFVHTVRVGIMHSRVPAVFRGRYTKYCAELQMSQGRDEKQAERRHR